MNQSIGYFCSSTDRNFRYREKPSPNIKKILQILSEQTQGISTFELSSIIYGIIRHSVHAACLVESRKSATRKQIQRARHYLHSVGSNLSIRYFKQEKVWRLTLACPSSGVAYL